LGKLAIYSNARFTDTDELMRHCFVAAAPVIDASRVMARIGPLALQGLLDVPGPICQIGPCHLIL
jgi:hypothetical protein